MTSRLSLFLFSSLANNYVNVHFPRPTVMTHVKYMCLHSDTLDGIRTLYVMMANKKKPRCVFHRAKVNVFVRHDH